MPTIRSVLCVTLQENTTVLILCCQGIHDDPGWWLSTASLASSQMLRHPVAPKQRSLLLLVRKAPVRVNNLSWGRNPRRWVDRLDLAALWPGDSTH